MAWEMNINTQEQWPFTETEHEPNTGKQTAGAMMHSPKAVRYLFMQYPGSSPNCILTQGNPPRRPHWTADIPCKAPCMSLNLRIQQHKMSLECPS